MLKQRTPAFIALKCLFVLLCAGFVFLNNSSLAQANSKLPTFSSIKEYRALNNTVTRITNNRAAFQASRKQNNLWARKNLNNGIAQLRTASWNRYRSRLSSDAVNEAFAKAIGEQIAKDQYERNLKFLDEPMRRVWSTAIKIVNLEGEKCVLPRQMRVQTANINKSLRKNRKQIKQTRKNKQVLKTKKAKRIKKLRNQQKRIKTLRVRQNKKISTQLSQCRSATFEEVSNHRRQLNQISQGVEAYRQAFVNIYITTLLKVEENLKTHKTKNRATSNESLLQELTAATNLVNRGRRAIGLQALSQAKPSLNMANSAQSEFYGMMHANNFDPARAARSGVGQVRQGMWFDPRGNSFNWNGLDNEFRKTARHGIRSLAVFCPVSRRNNQVYNWNVNSRDFRFYLQYVNQAVKRYGPNGIFWRQNPDIPVMPVRTWEICNEPNYAVQNPGRKRPQPRAYGRMLVRVSSVIKRADSGSIVLLAGLANIPERSIHGMSAAEFLKAVYSVPEVRIAFEGVSYHPYARNVNQVQNSVENIRAIMNSHGDHQKSIWITEIGWSSTNHPSSGPEPLVVGAAAQARNLTEIMNWFKANRTRLNIPSVFWYFWRDVNTPIGHASKPGWDSYAGLFDAAGRAKPSWSAWLSVTGGSN